MTVIPVDSRYHPWEIPLGDDSEGEYNMQVNMTAGSYFSIMMR